uniref:Uncharacterized protein n=1 Tax=Timema bartmani TaxID=61472 RepID=A0A7R9F5R9_9NEOP|nr:unnamed protein product [Timema bartmani]
MTIILAVSSVAICLSILCQCNATVLSCPVDSVLQIVPLVHAHYGTALVTITYSAPDQGLIFVLLSKSTMPPKRKANVRAGQRLWGPLGPNGPLVRNFSQGPNGPSVCNFSQGHNGLSVCNFSKSPIVPSGPNGLSVCNFSKSPSGSSVCNFSQGPSGSLVCNFSQGSKVPHCHMPIPKSKEPLGTRFQPSPSSGAIDANFQDEWSICVLYIPSHRIQDDPPGLRRGGFYSMILYVFVNPQSVTGYCHTPGCGEQEIQNCRTMKALWGSKKKPPQTRPRLQDISILLNIAKYLSGSGISVLIRTILELSEGEINKEKSTLLVVLSSSNVTKLVLEAIGVQYPSQVLYQVIKGHRVVNIECRARRRNMSDTQALCSTAPDPPTMATYSSQGSATIIYPSPPVICGTDNAQGWETTIASGMSSAHFQLPINWLLFLAENQAEEEFLEKVYIPFNSQFLVVIVRDGGVALTEVYKMSKDAPLQNSVWMQLSALSGSKLSLYERRHDLHGHVITSTAVDVSNIILLLTYIEAVYNLNR